MPNCQCHQELAVTTTSVNT